MGYAAGKKKAEIRLRRRIVLWEDDGERFVGRSPYRWSHKPKRHVYKFREPSIAARKVASAPDRPHLLGHRH
jgi:hypothetical protein